MLTLSAINVALGRRSDRFAVAGAIVAAVGAGVAAYATAVGSSLEALGGGAFAGAVLAFALVLLGQLAEQVRVLRH